jgi:hypothetical protein
MFIFGIKVLLPQFIKKCPATGAFLFHLNTSTSIWFLKRSAAVQGSVPGWFFG